MKSSFKNFFSGFAFIFSLLTYCENPDEVWARNYLMQFPKIRILIEGAAGHGHASTNITLLKKIRQLGYTGQIQIVAEKLTRSSLKQMIPELADIASNTTRAEIKGASPNLNDEIRFVNSIHELPADIEMTKFTIMGASDYIGRRNRAAPDLKTQSLIVINPPGWDNAVVQYEGRSIVLNFSKNWPLTIPLEEVSNAEEFLKSKLQTPELASKIDGLLALVDPNNKFETLMSYNNVGRKYHFEDIIYGYRQAVAVEPDKFKGPLVIGLLSDSIDHFGYFKAMAQSLPLATPPTKIEAFSISDSQLKTALDSMDKNDVIFVNIGNLPQEAFRWVLGQGTLPALVTGANSTNDLRAMGKTYISTSIIGHRWPSKISLASRYRILRLKNWDNLSGISDASAKKFFLATRDPNSSIVRDYAREAEQFNPKNDRFIRTLKAFDRHKNEVEKKDLKLSKFRPLSSVMGLCERLLYLLIQH
ncbi:MAG: hypothetical protein KA116_01200 [Proteobacteria bacterium]|nr:hypothetical protein [Pseudomonadota bacterium]